MKKIIFSLLFLGLYMQGFGQSVSYFPVLTNSIAKPLVNNPARTGSDTVASIFLNYKRGYNLATSSPTNMWLSVDTRLKDNRHAIGLNVMNDKMGYFQNSGAFVSYAFKWKLFKSDIATTSFGASIGFLNRHIDTKGILIQEENDPTYLQSNFNQFFATSGFGIHYNRPKGKKELNIDISVPNIIWNRVYEDRQTPIFLSVRRTWIPKINSRKKSETDSTNVVTGKRDGMFVLEPILSGQMLHNKFIQRNESYMTGYLDLCFMTRYKELFTFGSGYRYFVGENRFSFPSQMRGWYFLGSFIVPKIDCSINGAMSLGSAKDILGPNFELGLSIPLHKRENDLLKDVSKDYTDIIERMTIIDEKQEKNAKAIRELKESITTLEREIGANFKTMRQDIINLDSFNWERKVLARLDSNIRVSVADKIIRTQITSLPSGHHALLVTIPRTVYNNLYTSIPNPKLSDISVEILDKANREFVKTNKLVHLNIQTYIYDEPKFSLDYARSKEVVELAKKLIESALPPEVDKKRITSTVGESNYPLNSTTNVTDNNRITLVFYFK